MSPDLHLIELREPVTAHVDAGTLSRVAARARRRAVRAGDGEVDTGHLLHALLESDDRVLGLAAPLPAQATRLMGYLVQRSIGFGRAWKSDEGVELRRLGDHATLRWSTPAEYALQQAARAALVRPGTAEADALDLLAALAEDPRSRATEIMRGAGVDPEAVAARVRTAVAGEPEGELDGEVRSEAG